MCVCVWCVVCRGMCVCGVCVCVCVLWYVCVCGVCVCVCGVCVCVCVWCMCGVVCVCGVCVCVCVVCVCGVCVCVCLCVWCVCVCVCVCGVYVCGVCVVCSRDHLRRRSDLCVWRLHEARVSGRVHCLHHGHLQTTRHQNPAQIPAAVQRRGPQGHAGTG